MAKRRAGSDLNRDNWDREEEQEDEVANVGFQRASDEVLAGRKIKVARRRGSDAITTGGSDKPSIFKNFSGFSSMSSGGNSTPKFDFGAKKPEEPNNEMKKLFEASSFKPGSSSSSAASPSFPSFTFTSTSNKENSKPLESNSEPINGSTDSSKKPSGYDADKQAFYKKLKALNEGVLQWIQKHVSENSLINLSPVFDDYKEHFAALEKQYRPKFSKGGSSSTSEGASSFKNFSFTASSKSTNSTPPKSESGGSNESTKSKPLFTLGASDDKSNESVATPKETTPSSKPPLFTFGSSSATSSTTSEQKSKESTLFSFGTSTSESKSSEGSASGGFSFGATKEGTGFSFAGAGGLTFGAKEGSTFSGFGLKPMAFAPVPPVVSESKEEGETEAPPVPEVLEVKEENSFYEKKCKLFYKKDGNFVDRGVGTLYLKTAGETKKTQLIMRAATSLGNVLLNIVLNSSLPTQRMGKNNVLIVCVPNPPLDAKDASDKPATMLIRVKTAEDADELHKKINENKGE